MTNDLPTYDSYSIKLSEFAISNHKVNQWLDTKIAQGYQPLTWKIENEFVIFFVAIMEKHLEIIRKTNECDKT